MNTSCTCRERHIQPVVHDHVRVVRSGFSGCGHSSARQGEQVPAIQILFADLHPVNASSNSVADSSEHFFDAITGAAAARKRISVRHVTDNWFATETFSCAWQRRMSRGGTLRATAEHS